MRSAERLKFLPAERLQNGLLDMTLRSTIYKVWTKDNGRVDDDDDDIIRGSVKLLVHVYIYLNVTFSTKQYEDYGRFCGLSACVGQLGHYLNGRTPHSVCVWFTTNLGCV